MQTGARGKKIMVYWTSVSRYDDVGKEGENINWEIAWNSEFLKIVRIIFNYDVGIDRWIVTISLWICMRCNKGFYSSQ